VSYVNVTVGVTVNEKTYLRKLKDMTCFKGATSRLAHLIIIIIIIIIIINKYLYSAYPCLL